MNNLTTLAVKSKNGQYTTLDYYLTQVEKPLNLIQHDEILEAFQVPNTDLTTYTRRNSKGEQPVTLDSFEIEQVIGKGGFSKVM